MKKLKYGMVFLALVGIGIVSCEKEDQLFVDNDNDENPTFTQSSTLTAATEENWIVNDLVSYFLDGQLVAPGTYDPTDELLFTLVEGDSLENFVHFNAFTTKELYFDYGRENGYGDTLENMYLFEDHMRQYALDNGIVSNFENTGEVPETYFQYEQNMYARFMGQISDDRLMPLVLYKDYSGGPALWVPTGTQAMMIPFTGWDNEVSGYYKWQIFNFVIVYDNTFFRKRLGTIGRWGFQYTEFSSDFGLSGYNDRMSSVISS